MLVSHRLKLLFFHVPKTGGSSITEALQMYIATDASVSDPLPVGTPGWQNQWHAIGKMHDPWEVVEEDAQPLVEQGYEVMAGVRSPFERVASMWAIKGEPKGRDPYEYMLRDLPPHFMLSVGQMAGPHLSRVLRFEELELDWRTFCEDYGLEGLELPHANERARVGEDVMRRVYSDARCIELVKDRFAEDIEHYGYEPLVPRLGVDDHAADADGYRAKRPMLPLDPLSPPTE